MKGAKYEYCLRVFSQSITILLKLEQWVLHIHIFLRKSVKLHHEIPYQQRRPPLFHNW